MDFLIFTLFCLILTGSVLTGIPLVAALLAGLLLFWIYGWKKGFSFRDLGQMCLDGIKTVRNILITFMLIGIMTALWRSSGCIPAIVCYASGLIKPSVFIVLTFLLNALVSVLTGTSFGTSATMGVICLSIARSMNMPLFWVGGAMLSGVFFGDRCSPVSTSALLVSTLTDTDLYRNIKQMIRTALIPTLITCVVYTVVGLTGSYTGGGTEVKALFESAFTIHWICLLPAVSILVAAGFHLNVKLSMAISSCMAFLISLLLQHQNLLSLCRWIFTGFSVGSETLAPMIDGGGIRSMLRVAAIVCIASCYAGIFEKTGLLRFLERLIEGGGRRFGHFAVTMIVSLLTSAVACNQTLAIMLTRQMTAKLEDSDETRAINLEDTVVVIAPLIPWSIAGSVPLSTTGSPTICILGACFLYLLPIWRCAVSLRQVKKSDG